MQTALRVYGREGEACYRCGDQIGKTRAAGRGTWYCPSCQPIVPNGNRADMRVVVTGGAGFHRLARGRRLRRAR